MNIMKTFDVKQITPIIEKLPFIDNSAKKLSIFIYARHPTGGFCDFQCNLVTENKEQYEGGVGFIPSPTNHTKWCIRACPRFEMVYPKEGVILYKELNEYEGIDEEFDTARELLLRIIAREALDCHGDPLDLLEDIRGFLEELLEERDKSVPLPTKDEESEITFKTFNILLYKNNILSSCFNQISALIMNDRLNDAKEVSLRLKELLDIGMKKFINDLEYSTEDHKTKRDWDKTLNQK